MEQLSFDDLNLLNNTAPAFDDNILKRKEDNFGCCSCFRQCSDARHCLKPESVDYENCAYKKNLESGKIFYGKNANDFEIDTYNQLVKKYNLLDDDVRYELNYIILSFIQCGTSVMYYSSPAINTLKNQGFVSGYITKNIIANLCDHNFLGRFLSAEVKSSLTKQARAREKKNKARMKKYDVVDWILSHNIPEFNDYVNKFIIISIPHNMQKYIIELYYDFLVNDNREYKLILPGDREPFVKNSSNV